MMTTATIARALAGDYVALEALTGRDLLWLIGNDLDLGRMPQVYSGGTIWPSAVLTTFLPAPASATEEVSNHGAHCDAEIERTAGSAGSGSEPAGTDGSAAGSREGTPGFAAGASGPNGTAAQEQRSAILAGNHSPNGAIPMTLSGSAAPGSPQAASVVASDAAVELRGGDSAEPQRMEGESATIPSTVRRSDAPVSSGEQLGEALLAYPQLRPRDTGAVSWLAGRIRPVPRLPSGATILLGVPRDPALRASVWAWWDDGVRIGPRHTYADGSACVYEPEDPLGAWRRGEPLVTLLDMTAVWVARHLFLLTFDRWPGQQRLHTAFERREQHRTGELCGCGALRRYSDCHARIDSMLGEDVLRRQLGGVPLHLARAALTRRVYPRNSDEYERAALTKMPAIGSQVGDRWGGIRTR